MAGPCVGSAPHALIRVLANGACACVQPAGTVQVTIWASNSSPEKQTSTMAAKYTEWVAGINTHARAAAGLASSTTHHTDMPGSRPAEPASDDFAWLLLD
jgi:hypothetical protein